MMADPNRCPECKQAFWHMRLCSRAPASSPVTCKHDTHSRPYPVSLEAAKALGLNTAMAPAMCWAHVRGHGQCRLMVTTLCHCGRRVCPEHAPEPRP